MPKLTFVAGARYAEWRDLDAWNESDIDRNAGRFRSGVDVWIVQTYLHVRDALAADGWSVTLSDRFDPGAICVAHWDELHRLRWRAPLAYLIGVRADRPPVLAADKIVRQNTLAPDDARTVGIAPWPQPGMRRRRPERGDRVRRVGYFGRMKQAPAFFSDPAFRAELAALGLEFVPSEHDWQDYSEIDVVVAFRTSPPSLLRHKPVSKVSNAWLAGVPAIIGPEPAYLQLRESEHDMRVANDARGVIGELARMVREPAHYAAMRARAAQRAPAFDVPALRDRWLAFFRERVEPAYAQWRANDASPLKRYPWYFESLIAEGIAAKRFRALVRRESATLPSPELTFVEPQMPLDAPSVPRLRPAESAEAVVEDSVRPPLR